MSRENNQKQRVAGRHQRDGFISRNDCLKNYIFRLSAIIQDLEEEGYEFEPKKVKGDFVYYWKNRAPKIVYEIVERDGIRIGVKKVIPYNNDYTLGEN